MITLNRACEIAIEYLKKEQGKTNICEILETDKVWIFYGGDKNEIDIGGIGITIDKNIGEVKHFSLPDEDNFKLLANAIEIEIPKEYQTK